MKSSPSPTQRSKKTWALVLSSSGLSWESISPGEAQHHKSLGVILWDSWGIPALRDRAYNTLSFYWERACWDGESSSMEHLGEEPKVGRWRHWASLGRNKYAKMEREDTNSLLVGTLVCVSGYGLCFSVLYIYGLCSLMHLNTLLLTFLLVSLVAKFVDMISVVVLILELFCNYCFLHKNIECIILPILMNELLF